MRWSFLHSTPLPGAMNMAVDEWLLDRARRTGTGTVRVYSWSSPTISFGRHQAARRGFDGERARRAGLDVVRRLTGGRAVLHHREVTYAVAAPVHSGVDLRDDYAAINRLLADALGALGVAVAIVPAGKRMPAPGSAPCFELPAPGELTFRGRKLVGSAQVRDGDAWMQHGSILVHDDQHRLRDAALGALPVTEAATLSDALGREVTPAEFADVLREVVRATWDPDVDALDADLACEGARTRESIYRNDDWTWRR
ncbi:MAG: lipoate--protein ligase family protein [Gemmatimonadaceae bacterium]|nr:lipoate--protein ligase family protein [Gemmatimonadaceae bacterium]